jgi:hypothetical protein
MLATLRWLLIWALVLALVLLYAIRYTKYSSQACQGVARGTA